MKIVPFTIVVALLGGLAVAQQSKSQSISDIFQLMDGTDAGDTSTKSVGVEDVANQKNHLKKTCQCIRRLSHH